MLAELVQQSEARDFCKNPFKECQVALAGWGSRRDGIGSEAASASDHCEFIVCRVVSF